MIKYLLLVAAFICASCEKENASQLELSFTSSNQDTIIELKSFFITKLPWRLNPDWRSFKNVKSSNPNKFNFNSLDTGTYFGLLEIDYKGGTYHITIDSIKIIPGKNSISKELNLGSVRVPE
jgi:hypothetical protein